MRPVVHHVVADVLRVLLLQHRQPERQLRSEQVPVPAPRRIPIRRRTAVERRLAPAAVVAGRLTVIVAVEGLPADGAGDVAVEPPAVSNTPGTAQSLLATAGWLTYWLRAVARLSAQEHADTHGPAAERLVDKLTASQLYNRRATTDGYDIVR